MRHLTRITVVLAVGVALTMPTTPAFAALDPASTGTATAPAGTLAHRASGYGPWLVWAAGHPTAAGDDGAYAYDEDLVPAGAAVSIASISFAGRTRTLLAVRGLKPHHTYGTHLHTNACTDDPAAAGPHYQHRVGAADDPEFANVRNEVWMDVRTDSHGAGLAVAKNPWEYRAMPGSVVVHAEETSTDPDSPGTAGARVACLTLSRS